MIKIRPTITDSAIVFNLTFAIKIDSTMVSSQQSSREYSRALTGIMRNFGVVYVEQPKNSCSDCDSTLLSNDGDYILSEHISAEKEDTNETH